MNKIYPVATTNYSYLESSAINVSDQDFAQVAIAINWLYKSLQCSQRYKLEIISPTGHVLFGVKVDGGGRGREIRELFTSLPPPLSLFLTVNRPLGTNFFLSPAFRCH